MASTELESTFTKLEQLDPKLLTLDQDKLAAQLDTLRSTLKLARTAGQLGLGLLKQKDEDGKAIERLSRSLQTAQEEAEDLAEQNKALKASVEALTASAADGSAANQLTQLAGKTAKLEAQLKDSQEKNDELKSQFKKVATLKVNFAKKQIGEMEALQRENMILTSAVRRNRAGTAVRPGGAPKPAGAPGHKIGSSVTMKRKEMRAKEDAIILEEATDWIKDTCKVNLDEGLMDGLADGIILCQLIDRIDHDTAKVMGRVHKNAKPGTFFAHDNVSSFLKGCRKLGLKDYQLFAPTDLIGGTNERSVAYCMLAVSRVASAFGIDPPPLVKMEMEIDRLRALAPVKMEHGSGSSVGVIGSGGAVSVATSEVFSAKKGDAVDEAVASAVQEYGLIPPARLRDGEYQFGKQVVWIRQHKGNVLVRHRDEWKELDSFAQERLREEEEEKLQLERSAVDQANDTPALMEAHASASTDESDQKGSTDQAKRRHHDVDVYKEFFYLTALCCKLNHSLKDEDVCLVRTEDLFNKAREADLEFHQFSTWIDRELSLAYLEALENRKSMGGDSLPVPVGGLRGQRLRTMSHIKARPKKTRFAKIQSQEEEDEDSWLSYIFGGYL